MRIAVMGSGGVGGYYGALLAHSGEDVAFVARGAHLEAIRERGLRIESVHGDLTIWPACATDDPGQIGPVDLVLVAVKSFALEAAAVQARPLVGSGTLVLPLLNGLDAAERLAATLGSEHVLAGLTHLSSVIAAPGVIRQASGVRRIVLGELDGRLSKRAERVRSALEAAGIEAVLSATIQIDLWEKFLFIASIGGVCCLARLPIGPVLATPESRQLFLDAMREVEVLAQARGIRLPADAVERSLRLAEGFQPGTKPSLLAALEAGQPLELDAMSGAVVRLASEAGVPTPVHRVAYAALKPSAIRSGTP